MGRWLEKIAKEASDAPLKPPESPLGALEGKVDGSFSEKNEDNHPITSTDWLEWIAERCSLVPDDRRHLAARLLRLHPRMQQRLAERYIEEWHTAAINEPKPHKRDNVGRRAANLFITRLKREGECNW